RDAIALSAEHRALGAVAHAVECQATLTYALARATALRSLVVFLGGQLPLVVLLATAPWLLRKGQLTFAEVVGAATYLRVSVEPALRGIVEVVGTFGLDLFVTLGRLGEVLVRPVPLPARTVSATDRYDLAV